MNAIFFIAFNDRRTLVAYFHSFQSNVDEVSLPSLLAYPFYYTPHEIALIAAKELQEYLITQTDWQHNFGILENETNVGKMFGVLVVKNNKGQLGYLCAYSGRLAGHNQHEKFVPPVFDILIEDGFFRKGEAVIEEITQRIMQMEEAPELLQVEKDLLRIKNEAENALQYLKEEIKIQKGIRDKKRKEYHLNYREVELEEKIKELNHQSYAESAQLKKLSREWKEKIATKEQEIESFKKKINALKEERKNFSANLQNEIFDQYYFVNRFLEKKSVGAIFQETPEGRPKAGAGECAAPKLFQYAFLNGYEPIALAEFWWGQSPKTEVRIHGNFYPACRGKCEPILGHMLQGLNVEANPMLTNPAEGKDIEIIWEDDHIAVINKPEEFLSVPGKNIHDSVYARMIQRYPNATGPLIVHRLDMSTSGLLLVAKNLEVYKILQRQFIQREVKKRYVALLDGIVNEEHGIIDLPLRVDLEDRPRQMVCYDYGKSAQTEWQVIDRENGKTRVYFFPITGRTHQLRVHAAHSNGLGCPIVGDDIYGKKGIRLHLQAQRLEFRHPITKKVLAIEIEMDF